MSTPLKAPNPREYPAMFTTEMMELNLAGKKSETRRTTGLDLMNLAPDDWSVMGAYRDPIDGRCHWDFECDNQRNPAFGFKSVASPYGGIGDEIWGRETIKCGEFPPEFVARRPEGVGLPGGRVFVGPIMTAYAMNTSNNVQGEFAKLMGRKTTPAIHMPRSAARFIAPVTQCHPQRLLEITEEQAAAEGVVFKDGSGWWNPRGGLMGHMTAALAYFELWDSINGKGSHEANPWVWRVAYLNHYA